jgi:hypothetical protein
VQPGGSAAGNYTAVVAYTDSTGTHALFSVDFTVGQ